MVEGGTERDLAWAMRLTEQMRTTDTPHWIAFRENLSELGIEPSDAAIADLFDDDTDVKFGIAVVRTGEAITFNLVYSGHGESRRTTLAWEGVLQESDRRIYEDQIALGNRLLT